jgi:SAM-dependent methyltransferase
MMFGIRKKFAYFECLSCRCVQISEYPKDMRTYYPPNYYSYDAACSSAEQPLSALLKRGKHRARQTMLRWSRTARRHYLSASSTQRWLRSRPVIAIYLDRLEDPDARILDVGCGTGALLKDLNDFYYRNVTGADPFIAADVYHRGRLLVHKASLHDLRTTYDCISLHHALEHMPNQAQVLTDARNLLAPGGVLLVRIPVAGSQAWRTYQENWVQLDAPRHFYLHSRRSIALLAESTRLTVESISYDSTGFQFWGSELYCRDIPLTDPRSPMVSDSSIFSRQDLAEYESRAADLNAAGDGDQILAVLRRNEDTATPVMATAAAGSNTC